jgi:hypothetical protein
MMLGNTLNHDISASHMNKSAHPKDFKRAINDIISANVYDNSMVSAQDAHAAHRATENKGGTEAFNKTCKRLWDGHAAH